MTYKQLTIEERYQIKAYLKIGVSAKGISIELGQQSFPKRTGFNYVSEEKIQHAQ